MVWHVIRHIFVTVWCSYLFGRVGHCSSRFETLKYNDWVWLGEVEVCCEVDWFRSGCKEIEIFDWHGWDIGLCESRVVFIFVEGWRWVEDWGGFGIVADNEEIWPPHDWFLGNWFNFVLYDCWVSPFYSNEECRLWVFAVKTLFIFAFGFGLI